MHILIIKTSSLGDIIHVFPVLQYLAHCIPKLKIDWVVEQPFAELVRAHPLVHHVICLQTKKWRSQFFKQNSWKEITTVRRELRKTAYDMVLDLQGNVKSGLMTMCARSSLKVGFGYSSVPEWPNLLTTHQRYNPPLGKNIREDYLFIAQSALNHFMSIPEKGIQLALTSNEQMQLESVLERLKRHQGLKILICPGSNWPNKQLSQETWKSFLECFPKHLNAHFFFIWGHLAEKAIAEELTAALFQQSSVMDKLSLPALQNLMSHVDLVLAMDSLPLHLAGTTSTPTYSIFGASSAHKYRPVGDFHAAFQGSCPYNKKFEKRCDILRSCQTGACIKQVEGKQLFNHFDEWWSALKKR